MSNLCASLSSCNLQFGIGKPFVYGTVNLFYCILQILNLSPTSSLFAKLLCHVILSRDQIAGSAFFLSEFELIKSARGSPNLIRSE